MLGGKPECSGWEQGRPRRKGTQESWKGLGSDNRDQVSHCHSVATNGEKKGSSRLQIPGGIVKRTGKSKSFPQGNGKRAGEAGLYPEDPFEQSGDSIRIVGGQFLTFSNPGYTAAEVKASEVRSAWEIPNRNAYYIKSTQKVCCCCCF